MRHIDLVTETGIAKDEEAVVESYTKPPHPTCPSAALSLLCSWEGGTVVSRGFSLVLQERLMGGGEGDDRG